MSNIIKIFLLISSVVFAGGFDAAVKKQKFLQPEEAFKVEAYENGEMITVMIRLGEKIHIYDDTLRFNIKEPTQAEINGAEKPTPHEVGGEKVYEGDVTVNIPRKEIESKVSGKYTLEVAFEGCSDSGICYQPQSFAFDFVSSSATAAEKAPQAKEPAAEPKAESDVLEKIGSLTTEANTAKIADVLASEGSLFIILLFFVFGLLLSLTPCIFPMVPILSSIIVSQSSNEQISTFKAFFISLVYVLSMAITYTVVGLVAGLLGADIQAAMQNPWVLTVFAGLFVALAFSLFGYFEIGLPSSWQSRITKVSDSAQGKGILGTAVMGLLSALIVGPCVAPPLGGAILFISHSGDALLGGTALFVMSMGMGLPLLLVGIGAGKFMPRPGGWMTKVSQVFGLMMLGLALMMLSRILSDTVTILLWSMLSIGTALYLGLFNGKAPASIGGYLGKLFSILFLTYGVALFIGAISGADSALRPLEPFTSKGTVVAASPEKETADHRGYSVARLMEEVKASKKPVVVDFGKDSCTACLELEEITFPAPVVQKEMERFTFIKIDLTANTAEDKELLKKFELFGTPNIIFFDTDNNYMAEKTLTGFIKPEVFAKHLKTIR